MFNFCYNRRNANLNPQQRHFHSSVWQSSNSTIVYFEVNCTRNSLRFLVITESLTMPVEDNRVKAIKIINENPFLEIRNYAHVVAANMYNISN